MPKSTTTRFLICLSVILIVLSAVFFFTFHSSPKKIYIFADMTECEAFRVMSDKNGTFTEYTNMLTDDNLGDLSYVSCFAGTYLCDDYSFEFFAYEFEEGEMAKKYFNNCTGKNTNALSENFSLSLGLLRTHLAVVKDAKAYVVFCPTKDTQDVLLVLEEFFSEILLSTP